MPLVIKLLLCALSAASLLIVGSHALIGSLSVEQAVLFISMGGLSLLSPRAGVLSLLFLSPILGNRPGTFQVELLLSLSLGFQLGTTPHLWRAQELPGALKGSRGMLLLLAYCAVSVLSLSGVPVTDWIREVYVSSPRLLDGAAFPYLIHSWSTSVENRLPYLLLSVFWTLLSLQAALAIFQMVRKQPRSSEAVLGVVSASVLCALIAGILDYYGVIDLRALRALDPVVNPDNVQFRLQSWFGHSGWFAEFVTLAIPSSMVLLRCPFSFRIRVALLMALLLLGEFALILTFQRGGWLSYPLTLFVVWAAIYVTRRLERGDASVAEALRKSILKIVVSLPLTVVLSFALLTLLGRLHAVGVSGNSDLSLYLGRAKDISKASDRTEFMHAGFLLGSERPVLGGGSESFAYHFEREFENPAGAFAGRISLPLHGTAHNVYAQTFSGKGLVGLGLLLAMLAFLIVSPVRTVLSDNTLSQGKRVVLLSCAATGAAFAIYGNVQEVFYVQSLQYLFFCLFATASALLAPGGEHQGARFSRTLSGILCFGFLAQIVWMYAVPAKARNRPAAFERFGCYAPETDSRGSFQWCGPRGMQVFPVEIDAGGQRTVRFSVEGPPGAERVEVGALILSSEQGARLGEWRVEPGKEVQVSIAVPEEVSELLIRHEIGTGLLPKRDLAPSDDGRFLSYKLRR